MFNNIKLMTQQCQHFVYCEHLESSYSGAVRKQAFIGFRLPPELKREIEEIAKREERSLSQICEVLLRGGVEAYKRDGSKYMQKIVGASKKTSQDL